jgi:Kef-type K+ transport system membrane component KefB
VSITVETLNELGKLKTRTGINILGAAVIDDIIGLLLLSILFAYTNGGSGQSLLATVLGIVGFCVAAVLIVVFLPKFINRFLKNIKPTRAVLTFAICGAILAGFLAEEVGIAAIIGAYVFGSSSRRSSARNISSTESRSFHRDFYPLYFLLTSA